MPAFESSPALSTECGTTGMNQPFCSASRADPQLVLKAATPVQWCKAGLLPGPVFWLMSCTALHPQSCRLYWNVKTQTKQFGVSVSITIYLLQLGFDGGGMEKSTMKPPAQLITTPVLAATKDRSAGAWLHPSHVLLVLKLCKDEPPAEFPTVNPTNTVHPAAEKGLVTVQGLLCPCELEIFACWREFPAWRGVGQCPCFLQCAHRRGGEAVLFVVKNGHDRRAVAWAWPKHGGMWAATLHACPGQLCQLTSSPDLMYPHLF